MKQVTISEIYYINTNGIQHRVGKFAYKNVFNDYWIFCGMDHRMNGAAIEATHKFIYRLYNECIKLNTSKLVI